MINASTVFPARAAWRALRRSGLAAVACGAAAGCTTPAPAPALSGSIRPACTDVSFPIYFAKGSDELSDAARQAIAAGPTQVRGCTVREVDVFGLADMDGPADSNLALSRRRAGVVAHSLAASGLPTPLFDVQGLGESGAKTVKGAPSMLQRKTLVVIRVSRSA